MKKRMVKALVVATGILGLFLVSGNKVLAESVDLKGYSSKVTTENNKNYITNSKGKWELKESTQLFSSKGQIITLNNTKPVNIDSVYMQKNLEIRGKGELNLSTSGMFGMNVFGNLYAFTNTCYGAGKVTSTGSVDGVHVYGTLKLYQGILEGSGQDHGVWSNSDTYIYKNATLRGTANEDNLSGIGVWSNKQITACSNSSITGTGYASGVYTNGQGCKYIYSDLKSTIIGNSANINGSLSAIHGANNAKLKACSTSNLIEAYDYYKSDLSWRLNSPINITSYQAIKNNMTNLKNYSWTMKDATLKVDNNGITFSEVKGKETLVAKRTGTKAPKEKVYLPCGSSHIIKITNISMGGF